MPEPGYLKRYVAVLPVEIERIINTYSAISFLTLTLVVATEGTFLDSVIIAIEGTFLDSVIIATEGPFLDSVIITTE